MYPRTPKSVLLSESGIHHTSRAREIKITLRNLDAKYVGNKMPRRFQNFLVCLGNASANKDSEEIFVHYVGTGFGIPRHFAKGYDLVL